jgi:hypothetical protein
MGDLVLCRCGHSVAMHDSGCAGGWLMRCDCQLDRRSALEAAIEVAQVPVSFESHPVVRPIGQT